MRFLARAVAVIVLALLALIAAGGAMVMFASQPPARGQMVDIGGRSLRLVCAGPERSDNPTVLFESGAFGFAADWAEVQARLAAKAVRSCAYDRAGLGFSDPGPAPRDGGAVVGDLEALLAAAHEEGPFLYVGHSMAGLYARIFTARHPDKVVGLVLCDAAVPLGADDQMSRFVTVFGHIAGVAAGASRWGLLQVFSGLGDGIGLPPEAAGEKRWTFGRASQNHWAADEVAHWPDAARQAAASAPYDPALPIIVVLAGEGRGPAWDSPREAPARQSSRGEVVRVPGAGHATLLGRKHADVIVAAILRLMAPR